MSAYCLAVGLNENIQATTIFNLFVSENSVKKFVYKNKRINFCNNVVNLCFEFGRCGIKLGVVDQKKGNRMDSKKAMKLACQQVGVKEIAAALGVSPTAIYNQINDESKNDILQRFVEFCNVSGNDVAIQWACEQVNGVYIQNPRTTPDRDATANDCISTALKEFGDVIRQVGVAMEDGKITTLEAEAIRKEWDEVKTFLEGFVFACELGYLDTQDEETPVETT